MLNLVGVESEVPVQVTKGDKVWPAATSAGLMVDAICGLGGERVRKGDHWYCPDLESSGGRFLVNGARVYVDHDLLEYATPECITTLDAVAAVRAGDRLVRAAASKVEEATGGRVLAIRNNVDGPGTASYGLHVNVRMSRAGFDRIFADRDLLPGFIAPFFVTLPILCGAGSLVHTDRGTHYVTWQRARFIKELVAWQTTVDRPLVCERDEPLAADPERYARFHIIAFDANICEVAEFLKLGTLRLLCAAIDAEADLVDIPLEDPIAAVRRVARNPTSPLRLASGKTMRPLEIQETYLDAFSRLNEQGAFAGRVPDASHILKTWRRALTIFRRDPMDLVGSVDWVTKLAWLEQFRKRHGLRWTDPRLRWLDLQYHAISGPDVPHIPSRRLLTDEQVTGLITRPPMGSRAALRSALLERFGDEIRYATWHRIVTADRNESYLFPDDPPMEAVERTRHARTLKEAARAADLRTAQQQDSVDPIVVLSVPSAQSTPRGMDRAAGTD